MGLNTNSCQVILKYSDEIEILLGKYECVGLTVNAVNAVNAVNIANCFLAIYQRESYKKSQYFHKYLNIRHEIEASR